MYSYYITCNYTDTPIVSVLPQSPYMVQVGDQASLWCRGEGLPTPTIQWYKNNEMVYPSANLLLQVLYIPTDSPHTTVYTCIATNNAGNRNQTTKTDVLVNVCGMSINYYLHKYHYHMFICIAKCPQLHTPKNGTVYIHLGDDCKSNAIFKCNPGHALNGSYHLECVDGKWSNFIPTCVKKQAPEPTN